MRQISKTSFPLACLILSIAACSGNDAPIAPELSLLEARFELGTGLPAFLDVPFPSDIYLEADGTVADKIPGLNVYLPQNSASLEGTLSSLHGFGINGGVSFRIDDKTKGSPAAADTDSLPASEEACKNPDSSVLFIDLQAASPAGALLGCRAGVQDDVANGSANPPVLTVLPARGYVLSEQHSYAVVLTSKVKAKGVSLSASPSFKALRDGTGNSNAMGAVYSDALAKIKTLVPELNTDEMAAMSVFTTGSQSAELLEMRELLSAQPAPQLNWDMAAIAPMHAALFSAAEVAGYTATFDDWLGTPAKLMDGSDDPAGDQEGGFAHDALAAMGTAVFDAPNALQERPDKFNDPAHRTFARDAQGKAIFNPDRPVEKVWITIALPKTPAPPSGYPVVIVQHGLQGDRSFLLTLANTFAKRGFASVAIDAVTFGARALETGKNVDQISNFKWSETAKYKGPDGLVDERASALAFFGNFLSFGATRDQLRQAVLDIGSVTELLRNPNLDLGPLLTAVPGAKLDGSRLAYVGDSFGSVVGLMVAAVDPRISAMVMNVGGGGILTEMVANSPVFATAVGTAGGLTYGIGYDRFTWRHPMVNMLQWILDPADPLSHAKKLIADPVEVLGTPAKRKSMIVIEALWDELVTNEASEALAKAAGMPLVGPNVGPNGGVSLDMLEDMGNGYSGVPVMGATSVLVQASPATHGSDLYNAKGVRHYAFPFDPDGENRFPVLNDDIPVRQPYLGLQAMVCDFFAGAFEGKVPVVKGIPKPVRDFDDDGREDSMDADPNDPAK